MGHYNEQIAQAAKECREHREFIDQLDGIEEELLRGVTPLKAYTDTNLIDPLKGGKENKDHDYPLTDGKGDYYLTQDGWGQDAKVYKKEKPLKDTEGKAAGARYCYLADIANCVLGGFDDSKGYRDTLNNVGETLSLVVDTYDNGQIEGAMHYCSLLIENLLDVDAGLHHELVKVRANALSSGKYSPNGYKEEIDVNLLLDAAARHFLKILLEADIDEESGCTHEAHIAANVIMIHTQLSKYGE